MKELYWRYMVQIKAWELYLKNYMERSYRWDKSIHIFTAIASSSSIAAWAVWQQLSYLWAGIIAVSQILNAVKAYLPFSDRLKLLPELKADISVLYNGMEAGWYQVSACGEEQEIHDKVYEYRSRLVEINERHLKGVILPERSEIQIAAEKQAEEYFNLYFPKQQNRRYGEKRSDYVSLPVMAGLPVMKNEIQYPNRKEVEERQ